MPMDVDAAVKALNRMTVTQLRVRYAEVFGEAARSFNKQHLVKRIAWRLQAMHEGDLSERARRRARELANDADLRIRPPATPVDAGDNGGAATSACGFTRAKITSHSRITSVPSLVSSGGSPASGSSRFTSSRPFTTFTCHVLTFMLPSSVPDGPSPRASRRVRIIGPTGSAPRFV